MTGKLARVSICTVAVTLLGALMGTAQAQVPNGKYECWFMSSARGGLNFVLAGARYSDVEGKSGAVTVSGADIAFGGAALDGVHAHYKGGNPPTVSILGPRGDEVSSCELQR